MNIADVLRHSVKLHADKTALTFPESRFTYAEFGAACEALGRALYDLGLQRGDRVAILDFNSPELCQALFAAPACGLVALPLNFRLALPELASILADAEATVLIYSPDFAEVADNLRSEFPFLRHLVCTKPREGSSHIGKLMEQAPDLALPEPWPEETAHLLYTSGTTGRPKGVPLTHTNIISTLRSLLIEFGLRHEDRGLMVAPLFHVAACHTFMSLLARGCAVQVMAAFDPRKTLEVITDTRPTFTILVPAMISALLNTPGQERVDTSCLRRMVYAGAPMPQELLKTAVARFGDIFLQVYGLTETSALTCLRVEDHSDPRLIASAGRQMFGNEVMVVDKSGATATAGAIGEVIAKGDNVTAGYWNAPEETQAVLRNGWFHTGDVGFTDANGYIFLRDRKKDMIVSGGENVYPVEVENVLHENPLILEAAVIGVPDERWGERVHAIVHFRSGEWMDPQEVISYCREKLAGYKCPKSIEVSGPLPRTPSGKVQKNVLRAGHWKDRDRNIS
jgi:long-chain acyl-CoA synthetase